MNFALRTVPPLRPPWGGSKQKRHCPTTISWKISDQVRFFRPLRITSGMWTTKSHRRRRRQRDGQHRTPYTHFVMQLPPPSAALPRKMQICITLMMDSFTAPIPPLSRRARLAFTKNEGRREDFSASKLRIIKTGARWAIPSKS